LPSTQQNLIIYDFDLAELQVRTNLEEVPRQVFWLSLSLSKRMTINGKIKVIDKDISDFSVDRTKKRDWRRLKLIGL
jgi:hypothetical protein